MIVKAEFAQAAHKALVWFGVGSGASAWAMSWAEVELAVRIIFGVLSILSLTIHLCWAWSDRKKKRDRH